MQIWIDAKYLGRAVRHGRGNAHIKKCDAAKLFGLTTHEFNQIENGKQLLSEPILFRMMTLAFLQMRTRQFTDARPLKALKENSEYSIFISGN